MCQLDNLLQQTTMVWGCRVMSSGKPHQSRGDYVKSGKETPRFVSCSVSISFHVTRSFYFVELPLVSNMEYVWTVPYKAKADLVLVYVS